MKHVQQKKLKWGFHDVQPTKTGYQNPSFRAAIFSHCAVAYCCAVNGLQVCCSSLGKGHILLGSLGDVMSRLAVGMTCQLSEKN